MSEIKFKQNPQIWPLPQATFCPQPLRDPCGHRAEQGGLPHVCPEGRQAARGCRGAAPSPAQAPAVCATGPAERLRVPSPRRAKLRTLHSGNGTRGLSPLSGDSPSSVTCGRNVRPCKLAICVSWPPTAVNIKTAEIYRASFPDRGPEEELRAARALTGGPVSLKPSLC